MANESLTVEELTASPVTLDQASGVRPGSRPSFERRWLGGIHPGYLVLLLVLLVVTLWWKVSAHVAMAACWAVGLGVLSAPWAALAAAPVPVAVAVSRVRTGDHTPAQTVVGALIGVLVALVWASAARTVL